MSHRNRFAVSFFLWHILNYLDSFIGHLQGYFRRFKVFLLIEKLMQDRQNIFFSTQTGCFFRPEKPYVVWGLFNIFSTTERHCVEQVSRQFALFTRTAPLQTLFIFALDNVSFFFRHCLRSLCSSGVCVSSLFKHTLSTKYLLSGWRRLSSHKCVDSTGKQFNLNWIQ